MAYRHNYKKTVSFIKAKGWIDKWIKDTVRNEKEGTGFQITCSSMTEFLNRFIKRMNQASTSRMVRMAERAPLPAMGIVTRVPTPEEAGLQQ